MQGSDSGPDHPSALGPHRLTVNVGPNRLATSPGQSNSYGMSQLQRITFNPAQCAGRPCIRGMRIRVKDILDMLAAGASEAEILESYPYLQREDIQASLEYAAAQADHAVLSLAK